MPDFPHMKETSFPHLDNVNVYKYENDLDYSRYDYTQMKLCICRVPWDMGEAHIGNRTISGIGNVVFFGTPEQRDSWFESIPDSECVRIETKFKELHRDNEIVVPLPFDIACRYNYLTVEYSLFANDGSPLEYENDSGVRKWFWFIREVEFVAPNATRLHLLNDAWQTFIYDVDIPYMVLERGHAPLFETPASKYLANPMDNSELLLEPDVNLENAAYTYKHSTEKIFDVGSMYVCFVTSSNVSGNWGADHTNSWTVPVIHSAVTDGTPNYVLFVVHTENYVSFLEAIDENVPQFKQTVKACFIVASELVTLGTEFHFTGIPNIPCWRVESHRYSNETFISLSKSSFSYPEKYADLAKLYTFPYAYIEVSDENGNAREIRVEECNANVNLSYMLNTAYPALNLQAYLTGVGSLGNRTVEFKNFTTKSMLVGGKWFELQWEWAIPTFGVFLSASVEYDYSGYFEREQAKNEYDTRYDNAIASINTTYSNTTASNATAKGNADRSADASKSNADASADTAKNNTTTATTAIENIADYENTLRTNKRIQSNNYLDNQLARNKDKLEDDKDADVVYMEAAMQVSNQTTALTGWTNAAAGLTSSVAMGLISGGLPGAGIGAAAGVIQGVSGVVGASIAISNNTGMTALSRNNLITKTENAQTQMTQLNAFSKSYNQAIQELESQTNSDIADENVDSQNTQATRSQTTAKANATRTQTATKTNATDTKNTDDSNALATKTTDTANAGRNKQTDIDAVSNRTRQKGLNATYEYGSFADRETQVTKPKMLFANVVTESEAGISYAGDMFLRYGYTLNKSWDFNGNWNIGKYFTYWKLSDFWVKGLSIPDMYMDKLRFFLFGGVTVWRDPDDIGHVSIYENWA